MTSARDSGCVTNFSHGDRKLTIWRQSSGDFTLREFGILGERHPFGDDPLFQSLAAEIYRLACEVGRLRRHEIELEREAALRARALGDDGASA